LHLDWSTDSVHIVINSSNYELKFVNVIKAKDVPAPTVKDFEWSSWTCKLGFPVQGIHCNKEEYEITSTCANHQNTMIAAGEFRGRLSLFKFPAVCPPP
jgi:microtubule-associated protein-like 6